MEKLLKEFQWNQQNPAFIDIDLFLITAQLYYSRTSYYSSLNFPKFHIHNFDWAIPFLYLQGDGCKIQAIP